MDAGKLMGGEVLKKVAKGDYANKGEDEDRWWICWRANVGEEMEKEVEEGGEECVKQATGRREEEYTKKTTKC